MLDILQNIDVATILMRVIPIMVCITVHEVAHGYTAFKLGDDTAKSMGRLTLNPIKHIDPIGALMMLLIGFGWAKAVPVNMANFKHPRRDMALTALAGPLSNVIFAAIILFALGILTPYLHEMNNDVGHYTWNIMYITARISIMLAVFNMIPLPPLDGSKILFALLPDNAYETLMRVERYGFIVLIIIINNNTFRTALMDGIDTLYSVLSPIFTFAFRLIS